MAIAEFGRDVRPATENIESPPPKFLYDRLAAIQLASEFLINRPFEKLLSEDVSTLTAEDAYMKGKMDARAMILLMIGQVHILTLDPRTVDIYQPPMIEIKPLDSSQINILMQSYINARQYLLDNNFFNKPIRTISPNEAYAKGQMVQFKKSLLNLGKRVE